MSAFGETQEIVTRDGFAGLITVLDSQWLPLDRQELPDPSMAFLGVLVHLEAVNAELPSGVSDWFPDFLVMDSHGASYAPQTLLYYPEYQQIPNEDVPVGMTITGWLLFELPKSDVTFVYSGAEESIRVDVPGGPPVAAPVAEIPIGQVLEGSAREGALRGTVEVIGATWAPSSNANGNQRLGILVRVTAAPQATWATGIDYFLLTAADGTDAPSGSQGPNRFRPRLEMDVIRDGEQRLGWLTFELPRGQATLAVTDYDGGVVGTVVVPD